jgi:hypothetical protein
MFFEEDDVAYEEDCIRNPYSLKTWLRYLEHKTKNCTNWLPVYLIYERALKQLPGSYKLWHNYLKLRRQHLKPKCISDPEYEEVNDIYERCLISMNKVINFKITFLGYKRNVVAFGSFGLEYILINFENVSKPRLLFPEKKSN